MKRPVINCITPRTDAEWAPNHPLRRFAGTVMSNTGMEKFKIEEIALVCGKPGEPRTPCPPDDSDVACKCFRCGCDLLRRASANPAWQAACFGCWEILSS